MNGSSRITPHFAVTGALEPADFEAAAGDGLPVHRLEPAGRRVAGLPRGGRGGAPGSEAPVSASGTSPSPRPRHSPSASSAARSDGARRASTVRCSRIAPPACGRRSPGPRQLRAASPSMRVLQKLAAAGFDLEALRHELEDQHDPGSSDPGPDPGRSARRRTRWMEQQHSLRISRRRISLRSARQKLHLEPWIGREPGVVAPGRMRQGDPPRPCLRIEQLSPAPDGVGHAPGVGGTEVPALRVAADREDQLELRHGREQARVPGLRTLAARRQVAAGGIVAGKAESHRHDGDAGAGRRIPRG